MIDRTALLEDLKRLVNRVEGDLLARSEDADVPEIASVLRGEYERARTAKRTAATYGDWREDRITQAAVAWVLSCVFVRFMEDNDLISPPRLSGPAERLRQARDAHQHYFLSHPRETDRDYLLSIFDELAATHGTSGIFGPYNALREIPNWLSGDVAREVIQFFQKIDANTGVLIHDFTDTAWDTRFLGDLYQDLSAYARDRYALLQTPHFVEQFLLDRTLEPAVDEFGLSDSFKMIDPACGSGHLVLGSFERLLDRWQRSEPATPVRELVRRTIGSVHGVDINPYAVAIARFRLLLVAMRACGSKRLADAPDFRLHIECGDSLLHVPLIGGQTQLFDKHETDEDLPKRGRAKKAKPGDDECEHAYASENLTALKALLRHGQYHAVMANPPYIQPPDPGLRERYRKRFTSCYMQYSLSAPFMEHIYKLCMHGGFSGQITADTFMKREFGKRLIEELIPTIDLTCVVHTKGVPIPGHATSTVILFGRNRAPTAGTVRVVMGVRGEPPSTVDASKGFVWTAITRQIDDPGSQSNFVSVTDMERRTLYAHPWSLGGGGALELKKLLECRSDQRLGSIVIAIGRVAHTGDDEAYVSPTKSLLRRQVPRDRISRFVEGDRVRDFSVQDGASMLFPYDANLRVVSEESTTAIFRWLWRFRTELWLRREPNGNHREIGKTWYEFSRFHPERYSTPGVAFAFVVTHNHFAFDRGGKVFNRSAPVIKLPPEASEDDHLAVLGILNSSTACFWMKQVFHTKGNQGVDCGTKAESWEPFWEFGATPLLSFPLPPSRPNDLARNMQRATESGRALAPATVISGWASGGTVSGDIAAGASSLGKSLDTCHTSWETARQHCIALQEEMDWQYYRLYGLLDVDLTYGKPLPPVCLGERAFEIVMARRVAAGELTTAWFDRHGSTPRTDIPTHWPTDYRDLVQKRIDVILSDKNISLIEQPENKRRWNTEPWEKQQALALEAFLLDRLERLFDYDGRMNDAGTSTATLAAGLVSIGGLADAASQDPVFMEAAEVFVGAAGFDVTALVGQLVEKASVPFLPALRYKAAGLRKYEEWKEVWELQRKEDLIDARTTLPDDDRNRLTTEQAADLKRREVGDIPVPPRFVPADFVSPVYWKHRDKLDVPKESFVIFPFVTGVDGRTMIAWAGLDHLQLAKAIGDFYGLVQNDIGGSDDPRLVPLLAAIHELIPWIRQWHAGNDPVYGGEPADFFEDFIRTEAAARGMTVADVIAWQPPARARAKRAAKKTAKRATRRSRSEETSPTTESAES